MSHKHPSATITPPLAEAPDTWHDHSHDRDHPQHAHGELANAHLIVAYGFASMLIVVVASVAVYLYYIHETVKLLDARETRGQGMEAAALAYRETAQKTLREGNVWADAEFKHLQLPIEEVRKKVAAEYAARKD